MSHEPGIYRSNRTGGIFEVLMTAAQVETNSELVIYRQCFGRHQVFAKSVSVWEETIIRNGIQMPRFEPVIESDPRAVLQKYYGYNTFRPNQEQIINNILSGHDTLNILPTGAGKSVCFQIPAVILPGLTIVISPLIALMEDQIRNLQTMGISAAFVNSGQTQQERSEVYENLIDEKIKLLYLAPEQFENNRLNAILHAHRVSLIAVDEAHCVSQWGHDFRPSYASIKQFVASFQNRPIVAAFTATATNHVIADIQDLIGLTNPIITKASVDRPNLYYSVLTPQNRNRKLVELVRARQNKSGIIYCATRRNVERCNNSLRNAGIQSVMYHAGMTSDERSASQMAFISGESDIIVATNAFGMGIDKPDIRFVIHYNMPRSLEAYYQEAGRAGRDGEEAECILLYSATDIHIQRTLLENQEDTTAEIRERNEARLSKMILYATQPDCLRYQIMDYFGEHADGHCGHCYNCAHHHESIDITNETRIILSCVREINGDFGITSIIGVLHGDHTENIMNRPQLANNRYFGMLQDIDNHRLWLIIHHLVSCNLLEYAEIAGFRGMTYPVIRVGRSPDVDSVMNEDIPISMYLPVNDECRAVQSNAQPASDQMLYNSLRALRTSLARRDGVPAYVVFTDSTLREISLHKPATLEALRQIPGIGDRKLQKYGNDILKAIKENV